MEKTLSFKRPRAIVSGEQKCPVFWCLFYENHYEPKCSPRKTEKTSCTKGHKTSNIFDIFELKKIPALQNLMRAPSSGRLVTSFFFFNHWTHCFSVLFRASFGPKNEHEKLTDMLASFLKGMTLLSIVTLYSLLAEKVLPLMKALLSGHRSRILIKKKQWDR